MIVINHKREFVDTTADPKIELANPRCPECKRKLRTVLLLARVPQFACDDCGIRWINPRGLFSGYVKNRNGTWLKAERLIPPPPLFVPEGSGDGAA